ncbi:MAG: thioredoxin domain-containing protein [Boseongicola sp.]|nr:MAG: thioredoxin domain-containing protein [Boseongicola sp.]
MSEKQRPSRRNLLLGLGTFALVGGGWQAWIRRPRALEFTDIDGLPGWRQTVLDGMSVSRSGLSGVAFAGLDSSADQTDPLPANRLCRTLFEHDIPGKVPVAAFSDFFCPYCRVLTGRLAERASDPASDISISWHELPLLGPSSIVAAKAAIAADLQGGYAEFQARLMGGTFRPTARYLTDSASSAGLQAGKLILDMDGQIVTGRLSRSRAAARTLGIFGTPAIVVGRTLVMGEISDRDLDTLIEMERETPARC